MPELNTEELALSLINVLPGYGLALGITQLDPELVGRPGNSAALQTVDYIQTSRISIRGSFEEYWAQRGKNLRHNLKRQRNQLARQGVECHVDTVTSSSEVASAVAEYSRLESAGWKAETGTAVGSDDAQGRFYTQLLQEHSAHGRGPDLPVLARRQVVATDLCIDNGETLVILKTCYNEAIPNLSPALLLREEYFRELFGAGMRRIEFYGKLMDWHTKWSDEIQNAVSYRLLSLGPCWCSAARPTQDWRQLGVAAQANTRPTKRRLFSQQRNWIQPTIHAQRGAASDPKRTALFADSVDISIRFAGGRRRRGDLRVFGPAMPFFMVCGLWGSSPGRKS